MRRHRRLDLARLRVDLARAHGGGGQQFVAHRGVGERGLRPRREAARRAARHGDAIARARLPHGALAQVARQVFGARVSRLERLRQRLGDDVVEQLGHVGIEHARRRRDDVRDLVHQCAHAVAGERRRAGQHLVEHHAEREDVRLVRRASPQRLLRRHVLRRTEHGAGLRQLLRGAHARDAEVGDLHSAVVEHHDVRRLDVAVHDAARVGVGQAVGHLRGDRHRLRHRQARPFLQDGAQLGALDELHRHVGDVLRAADVVDGDDRGVVQAAGGARLLREALLVILDVVAAERHVDGLDGDGAPELRVGRLVDDAHRAAAEFGHDLVPPELRCLHAARSAAGLDRAEHGTPDRVAGFGGGEVEGRIDAAARAGILRGTVTRARRRTG